MKQIVVIAHDKMKPELVNFFKEREGWLWGKELIATGKTADAVEAAATEYLMELNPYAPAGSKQAREYQKSTRINI